MKKWFWRHNIHWIENNSSHNLIFDGFLLAYFNWDWKANIAGSTSKNLIISEQVLKQMIKTSEKDIDRKWKLKDATKFRPLLV